MNFDEKLLEELGLSAMPEEQRESFLEYVQDELEIRVGERISQGLTDAQLDEFDALEGPVETIEWFEKNRPDYKEVVARTIEEMKAEIRANRDKLV